MSDTPLRLLAELARAYPQAWRQIEDFRARRGRELPDWPEWCYVPFAASLAVASNGLTVEQLFRLPPLAMARISHAAAQINAAAAWRLSQGVYRFHPALRDELWHTPIEGRLPTALLNDLPEFALYLEIPYQVGSFAARGAFAQLEHDANTGRRELRLLLDTPGGWIPLPLHLDHETLDDCVAATVTETNRVAGDVLLAPAQFGEARVATAMGGMLAAAAPVINLLLYLVSPEAEIRRADDQPGSPQRPQPTKTKRGPRWFPAPGPTVWEVGGEIGAALECGQVADAVGAHAGLRPHIRRAHWHLYWTGPKSGEQKPKLNWLHPILVAGEKGKTNG